MVRGGGRLGAGLAMLLAVGACGGSVTSPGAGADGGTDTGGGGFDAPSGFDVVPTTDGPSGVDALGPDTGVPVKQYDGTTGKTCAS